MSEKIKNLKEVADRIKKAVANKEQIILYGDSDMDGISSVVILEEAIKSLGGHVDMACFPDRENDGYGLNFKALEFIKDKAPSLLVTLDLGIGNLKEVAKANELGFEVIIVDHHEPLQGLPPASLIIDIKQPEDKSSFKGLANVGITYNLCLELLGSEISPSLKNSFLELAALGTIADMVPQIEQNEKIIEEGLRSLKNTFRPGLKAFLEILGNGKVFEGNLPRIISALNASESVDFKNESYVLLRSTSLTEAKDIAEKLLQKNYNKQQNIKNIVYEVERRLSQKEDSAIIFEGDPAWKLTLAGSAASILFSKYQKPVFIYKKMDKESCGSVRNPKDTNSVEAMKSCADLLTTYGGHSMASGFRLNNENLEAFRQGLINYFTK